MYIELANLIFFSKNILYALESSFRNPFYVEVLRKIHFRKYYMNSGNLYRKICFGMYFTHFENFISKRVPKILFLKILFRKFPKYYFEKSVTEFIIRKSL